MPYQITFPAQSNRASWVFLGQVSDLDDDPIDLSLCSMVFAVRDKNGQLKLEASTDNGKLTYPDIGKFRWFFTVEEMRGLCAEQHSTGLTLTNDDGTQTVQFAVGPLAIMDGVVP